MQYMPKYTHIILYGKVKHSYRANSTIYTEYSVKTLPIHVSAAL